MEKCLKTETTAMGSNSAQKPGLHDEAACPEPSRMALRHGLPTWPSLSGPSTLRRPQTRPRSLACVMRRPVLSPAEWRCGMACQPCLACRAHLRCEGPRYATPAWCRAHGGTTLVLNVCTRFGMRHSRW
jgi:hypothetical protein